MKEKEIIKKFIQKKLLQGTFKEEVHLSKLNNEDKYKVYESFRIDLVVNENNGTLWIFEVKENLNTNAIGQIISYSNLLKKPHNKAIICKKANPNLIKVCEMLQIKVFLI